MFGPGERYAAAFSNPTVSVFILSMHASTYRGTTCVFSSLIDVSGLKQAEKARERQAWEASFAADPIDLRDLQTRERVGKARDILRRLAAGEPYTSLGGKRWESDRNIVSVPVGRGHRLVLRDEGGRLRPLACMTHEAYNGLRPGKLG